MEPFLCRTRYTNKSVKGNRKQKHDKPLVAVGALQGRVYISITLTYLHSHVNLNVHISD